MAAYPVTVWTKKSTRRTLANIIEDESGGGEMLLRVVGPPQYLFTIDHRLISQTDANTLETFWETNILALVQLTWQGVVYDTRFTSFGMQINRDYGPFYRASAQLRGVPQ